MAPIDVIRSDGQIVYQNTTGNPQWESQHGGGGSTQSAAPSSMGSSLAGLLQGNAGSNIQQALGQIGGANDSSFLQKLIAQLQGAQ